MDFVGPILDIIKCSLGPISQQVGYIKDLNHNLDILTSEAEVLKCMHDGVRIQVEHAVSSGKMPTPIVQNWLEVTGIFIAQVDSVRSELEAGRTRCCCANLKSHRKLGKRVIGMIDLVRDLKVREGDLREVATSPSRSHIPYQMQVPPEVEEQRTSLEAVEDIYQWLKDKEVEVICVWGMGGVGKTTIMKQIYNKLTATRDFHQVIWVTVSKDLDMEVIRKRIGKELDVEFCGDEDAQDKQRRLQARLRKVRYLLILDDLWQEFSLEQVGIPRPTKENGCKIVITTRLNEVSNKMEADRQIRIKPLGNEEAWNLFCSKTGKEVQLPEIRPLAEKVVKECGGLPLGIVTVGRAMRHKRKKELWQHALKALKGAAPEIPGMEREVFLPLKLSYDCLEDPQTQSCFLYCSLYPEDYGIYMRNLVRFWAFEQGWVNNVETLDDALNKGHVILEKLMDACLLEKGTDEDEYVRMHDLVRDLAIWITSPPLSSSLSSSSYLEAQKFLVKSGVGLEQLPEEIMWEGMTKISLMRNEIIDIQIMPNCPNLVTLLLQLNEKLHTINDHFFRSMPKLQTLDLWNTGIKSLPQSLSLLVNLRVLIVSCCLDLKEMPPLGDLKELQVLDLCYSGIKILPEGFANLGKLKFLDLSWTNALSTIPGNVIRRLTGLEELRLKRQPGIINVDTWREVATLPRLTSLHILLPGIDAFTANDMSHPMWSRLTRYSIYFGRAHRKYSPGIVREVKISDCQHLPTQISLTSSAEYLSMWRCQGVESLSQIISKSKTLKCIELREARGLKCVINCKEVGENNAFECLETLELRRLPTLHKVFDGALQMIGFGQLTRIIIFSCPKLKFIFPSSMVQSLHQLESLFVSNCEEIEEIVEGGPFPDVARLKLKDLTLVKLPKLRAICKQQQLVLTSMTDIQVIDCSVLMKLPILCHKNIQEVHGEIRGGREWWEGIKWEDDHSKSLYSQIYEEKLVVEEEFD